MRFSPKPLRIAPLLSAFAALLLVLVSCSQEDESNQDWQLYKQRFLADSGRIVDTGNGGISHSEGQGFAMLLAVAHGDRPAFDLIWNWTSANLQQREDKLHVWRWTPDLPGHIDDTNNATDGDLLIAWALARAADSWGGEPYGQAAADLAQSMRRVLLRRVNGHSLLLPGSVGFEFPERIVINPSYFVLPAYAALGEIDPSPVWSALEASAVALIDQARFGQWQLPPDWLELGRDGTPRLAQGFESRFGYEAVRVPLYMLWAGYADIGNFADYWGSFADTGRLPPWTDLASGEQADYDASPGIKAVAAMVGASVARQPISLPALDEQQDYYSASLLLLAKTAWAESPR
ncbi:MAG: glycosyl hydrolase family 8 [Alphaproteobacteria bacterium]